VLTAAFSQGGLAPDEARNGDWQPEELQVAH
jgi:hypothetical protein